ncbi:MAG: hypothetical protein K2I96_03990 [Lachnospiraceae bacterium]|nr:hypothetical protein [Lachnospiraceae bacterium]
MAVEIVFCAVRAEQMTPQEDAKIEEISRKYMEEYKGKKFEGPGCIVGEEGEPVFSGSVRIPFRSVQNELDEFLDYWLRWLTEITYVLVGAEWEAGIEGVPLLWDEGKGWRLMTDEEYRNLM